MKNTEYPFLEEVEDVTLWQRKDILYVETKNILSNIFPVSLSFFTAFLFSFNMVSIFLTVMLVWLFIEFH